MRRRSADPRPPIEVVGAESDLSTTQHVAVGPRSPRGRGGRFLAGAGALAAIVVLGLTLSDGDETPETSSRREERDNRERSDLKPTVTTDRATTTRPTTTTTTIPVGPVISESLQGTLLVYEGSGWVSVDLGTGARLELDIDSENAYEARGVQGGIVVIGPSPGGQAALYYDLRSGRPDPEPRFLGRASQVVSAGSPERVWVIDGRLEGNIDTTARANLVDLSGDVLQSFDVPSPYVTGGTDRGVVIARGGRSYLVDEDGTRPLGLGDVVGMTPDAVVAFACDDRAVCAVELQPIDGGDPIVFAALDGLHDYGFAAIAATSDRIALLRYPSPGGAGPSIVFYDGRGRLLGSSNLNQFGGEPRWLPGDLGVVSPTGDGVSWTRLVGDKWVTSELPALDGLDAEVVVLVPS